MSAPRPDDWDDRPCRGISLDIFDRPLSSHANPTKRRAINERRWEHARSICAECPPHIRAQCVDLTKQSDLEHGAHLFAAGRSPEERTKKRDRTRPRKLCAICSGPVTPPRIIVCSEECTWMRHNEVQKKSMIRLRYQA